MKWLSRQARRLVSARVLGVGLLAALLALRLHDPGPLEELRLRTFDLFQLISPRVAEKRPVVIVDIDEASLRKLGQWPWPRTRVAELIDRLTQHGAAAIAFDVDFCRARPAFAGRRSRHLQLRSTRRRGPSCAPCPATTRSWPRRSSGPRSFLAKPSCRFRCRSMKDSRCRLGLAYSGCRPQAIPLQLPGAASQHSRRSTTRPPAAVSSASFPSGTASCAACRWSSLAQDRLLPTLTLEMHAGGHPHEHAHDAGRQ